MFLRLSCVYVQSSPQQKEGPMGLKRRRFKQTDSLETRLAPLRHPHRCGPTCSSVLITQIQQSTWSVSFGSELCLAELADVLIAVNIRPDRI